MGFHCKRTTVEFHLIRTIEYLILYKEITLNPYLTWTLYTAHTIYMEAEDLTL